jgi:DUF4097 and DUF4098 domain-containing protein YvlB
VSARLALGLAAAALALASAGGVGVAHADDGDGDAGAAAAEVGTAADAGAYEHDVVEVKPGKQPIGLVTVANDLGDVRVEGHDGDGLVIYATKRGPDHAALDQMRVSLSPDGEGVRITTAIDRGAERTTLDARTVRIDLVIRAPRDARVDARVGRGALVLRNMDAGGELDAGAGAITVENVSGTVYARSVDGDQSFAEVFGTVDAQAIDADLALDTVRGDALVAQVHDGRIDGRRIRSRSVELRTTRGDIHLDGELALGGKMIAASLRGNVTISVKSAGRLAIKARAGGKVAFEGVGMVADASDRDGEWVRARYGKGKKTAAVELRSRYGDVRFTVVE